MIRFGFGLEAVGRACLRAPRLALICIVLVLIAAGASALRLTFDHELLNLYRSDNPNFAEYEALVDHFPVVENQLLILFEGKGLRTGQGLSALRSAVLEAQFVDGVTGVMSIFGVRERPGGFAGPPPTVIPAELPDDAGLDEVLRQITEHPLAAGTLITPDGLATLMLVSLDSEADTVAAAIAARDVVAGVLRDEADGVEIDMAASGAPLLRQEIIEAVRRDQLVLTGAGMSVTIILCLIYFRRWRYALITMAPGLAGIIATLGGFGLAGQSVNALTNVLPTLILVLAFADALHMVHAVRNALGRGDSAIDAARHAVRTVGPAVAMTSLTTALVFLALAASPSPTISAFGFSGAWASAMAFLAVITMVPTLSALLLGNESTDANKSAVNLFEGIGRSMAGAVASLVDRRPHLVALAGFALLVLTTVGYFSADTRYGYRDFLPNRSSSNIAIDRIDALFGGADSVNVLIVRRDGAPVPGNLSGADVVRAVHLAVDDQPDLSRTVSLKSLEDWLGEDVSNWKAEREAGTLRIPDHLALRLESADGAAWLVTAYLPAVDALDSIPVFDRLDAALDPVREAAPEYTIAVTGLVPMTARASSDLISSLNESLVAAIAVTMLLIAVTLRSVFLGVLAAAPNLLPLAAAGTYLYLTGEGLQITSVVALTIAFGIAVDDTIHLLNRWQREAADGEPRRAVRRAADRVGPILVVTTIVLIAGTGTTLVSEMGVVRLFGTLCIITFAAALIADLFLMPALMMVFSRYLPRRNGS